MKYKSSDPNSIAEMFGKIARQYDRTNLLMSFGLNLYWNHKLVSFVRQRKNLLDICAGTGIVGFSYLEKNPLGRCTLLDFCPEMIEIAKKEKRFIDRFDTLVASAEKIPIPDQSYDAATIAYGIRNISNLPLAFSEIYRVLESGGSLAIFELTKPENKILKSLHRLYLKKFLPTLGKWGSGRSDAYEYLSESILNFLPPSEIKNLLEKAQFRNIRVYPLAFGAATIIVAEK